MRSEQEVQRRVRKYINRLKKMNVFQTARGMKNSVLDIDNDSIIIQKKRSEKGSYKIAKRAIERSALFVFRVRTITKKELEAFTNYTSAFFGLLEAIFEGIARIYKLRELRLSLLGTRVFFSGFSHRAPSDFKLAQETQAEYILLSYYYIRQDKTNAWRRLADQYGFRGKILLDSGAYSLYNLSKFKEIKDEPTIHEYIEFVKENRDYFCMWASFDKIGNDNESRENYETMIASDVEPMPIIGIDSPLSEFQYVIEQYDPAVVGIGGILGIKNRNARRARLKEIFTAFPNTNFHGLGVADSNLVAFNWFSCDTTSWLIAPRKYLKVQTIHGQKECPKSWSLFDRIAFGVKELRSLEHWYQTHSPTELII
ncbi:hypothetical protein [Cohnella phaseoli]|uniref:Uncharacterized protein n=1 Tax=Cohnella phaseoli TaxID=456490 RepID=A0A3D9JPC8_9BACL|nr:hypothetical protein [Cohnella phaseoli]RED75961.1 hypothetical protein DFP98_11321 [Cohnella phaseoli]